MGGAGGRLGQKTGPSERKETGPSGGVRIDLAIIDPPRQRGRAGGRPAPGAVGIARLLYVACDPATLARDARLLVEAGLSAGASAAGGHVPPDLPCRG